MIFAEGAAPAVSRPFPLAGLMVITGALILVLGMLTVWMLLLSYDDALRAQKASLRNVATAFAAQTRSVAKAVDGATVRAASIVRFRGASGLGEVLGDGSSAGALDDIRRLAVVDAAGRVVASIGADMASLPPLPPLPARSPGSEDAHALRITLSDIDPDSGRAFINFIRPLTTRDGAPDGAVVAQVDSTHFQSLYSLVELGEGGSVTLFHHDGTMLVRGPAYAGGIGVSFHATPLFREQLPRSARGGFATRSPLDAAERLYGYDSVGQYPLVVIAGTNRNAALASWYGRLWTALVFYLMLSVAMAFLAWRVARDAQRQAQLIDLLSASETRLGNSFAYLTAIIDAVAAPIWVLDARLRIVMANQAFARLVGRASSDLVGQEEQALFAPDDAERIRRYRKLLEEGVGVESVGVVPDPDGEARTVIQLTNSLDAGAGDVQLVSVLTDITALTRAEAQLAYLAEFDVLTGLPNQVRFLRQLEQRLLESVNSGRPLAILVVVLERLHEIADLLGPDASNRALAHIGALLRDAAGAAIEVAHLRGAEFAVLLDAHAGRSAVECFAVALHERLSAPVALDGREFCLGPALGVALFPEDAGSADALYRCAQRACGSHGGESDLAIRFHSTHACGDLDERLRLEAHLRRALERDELRLVFQPKATVADARVVGFEALLRWTSPALGEVAPVRFIPIAERTGLILPIGAWVLEQACRSIGAWSRELGRPVKIAVNLSPRQFYQKSLLPTLVRCLREHGVPAGCLELEITETALMSREEEVDRLMHAIRALGVELSIDDFGTGYSSLAYLKRFPVSRLKVDRAFVRDLGRDEDSAVIARSIVNLARGLKLSVVAEGVETHAQLAALRAMACDEYQGFLFSRPLEAAAALALLVNETAGVTMTGSVDD